MMFTSATATIFALLVTSVVSVPAPVVLNSRKVTVPDKRAGAPFRNPITLANNVNKCVGLVGGKYANGTTVDIFDCNGSISQVWQFNGGQTGPDGKFVNQSVTTTPVDDSEQFCLDAGNVSELKNGVLLKIWHCFPNLPQQTWTLTSTGQLKLSVGNFCADLKDGVTTNRNPLQIWECAPEEKDPQGLTVVQNANQVWKVKCQAGISC